MNCLYHWVPKNMRGNVLFPLNMLKGAHPDIYEKEVRKYAGRENVMQKKIPPLDCLWNDALHLSAVHPSCIKEALIQAGMAKVPDMEFFEIDPQLLAPEDTTVYLYPHDTIGDRIEADNFIPYDPADMTAYSTLPQDTKDYYREALSQGKKTLLFHKVPHILFKGSLDVSKIRRIAW